MLSKYNFHAGLLIHKMKEITKLFNKIHVNSVGLNNL